MTADAGAQRVTVLMYHRIDRPAVGDRGGYCVEPRQFAAQLDWLAAHDYRPCTITAFDRWFHGQAPLPLRSVLITFDDGFAGLHRHAMPLLAARGWPATVFLVSGLIGQHDLWTSKEFGTAGSNALLNKAQISEMASHGFEFHSHSRTHPDLTTLNDLELEAQIQGSRHDLQALLGTPVNYFAYPFGRFDARVHLAIQAAGYRLAFSVNPGFNRAGGDALAVRRLDILGPDSRTRFGRKVAMGTNDGSLGNQLRYLARRFTARLRPPAQAR
jgi:peptidoglycan/xylan/chitin deacetylase (PgdA/CDA1 family)